MSKPVEVEQVTSEYEILNPHRLGEITSILTPPGFIVKEPIRFKIQRRAGYCVVRSTVGLFNNTGFGVSQIEAVNDLAGEFVRQYRNLKDEPNVILDPRARRRANWLRARLEFTPP